jgi:hypothetical protein
MTVFTSTDVDCFTRTPENLEKLKEFIASQAAIYIHACCDGRFKDLVCENTNIRVDNWEIFNEQMLAINVYVSVPDQDWEHVFPIPRSFIFS